MSRRAMALNRDLPHATAGVPAPTDRRFRRPDVRPGRHQRLGRFVVRTGVVVIAAIAIVGLVAWALGSILASRALAVSHITIHGNQRLTRGEVEALVDGLRGENILRVDFALYRRRLMDSPWVADVHMARVLPSTVDLQIAERVPMAVARVGAQLFLVDDTGVIIDEFGPQYQEFDLPIVDGLVARTAADHAPVDTARVRLIARCLADLQSRPDLRSRVSQLDVSDARDVVALLTDDAARLHLGDTAFADRLTTYLQIAPTLRQQLHDLDYVDLRFGDRVFVRAGGKTKTVDGKAKTVDGRKK